MIYNGIILASLLFAVTGCIVGAAITASGLSPGFPVGFVTILIAARNAIIDISHYRHLAKEQGERVHPIGPLGSDTLTPTYPTSEEI